MGRSPLPPVRKRGGSARPGGAVPEPCHGGGPHVQQARAGPQRGGEHGPGATAALGKGNEPHLSAGSRRWSGDPLYAPPTPPGRFQQRSGNLYARSRNLSQWREWAPAILDNYMTRSLLGRHYMSCRCGTAFQALHELQVRYCLIRDGV